MSKFDPLTSSFSTYQAMYTLNTRSSALLIHSSSHSFCQKYSSLSPGWRTDLNVSAEVWRVLTRTALTHRNPIHWQKISHWVIPIDLVARKFHCGLDCWVIWLLGGRIEVSIELVHSWYYSHNAGWILWKEKCGFFVLRYIKMC